MLSDDISDDKIAICIAPGSPSIRPYQDTVCLPWTIGKAGEALLGSKADEWERWEETKSKWRPSLGSNGLYTFSPFALFVISDMPISVRGPRAHQSALKSANRLTELPTISSRRSTMITHCAYYGFSFILTRLVRNHNPGPRAHKAPRRLLAIASNHLLWAKGFSTR